MLEALIVIFAVGFGLYYMIRHPLITIRRILQALGIFTLGVLGIVIVGYFVVILIA